MKKFLAVAALLLVSIPSLAEEAKSAKAEKLSPDTVVARVNDEALTYKEYMQAMTVLMGDLRSSGRHANAGMMDERVRKQVLVQAINRKLLLQEAMKEPMPDLEKAVAEGIASFRARVGTEENFAAMLAESQIDEATLKESIRQDIAISWYVSQKIETAVEVSEKEARAYYDKKVKAGESFKLPERVDISHILVKGGSDPAASRKKLSEIRERILAGEEFKTLAFEFNESPLTKQYGGLLGPRGRKEIPAAIADACFALEPGGITEVLETPYGFEIFRLNAKLPPVDLEFDEVKADLMEYIRTKKVEKGVEEKVKELTAEGKVEILLPHL